LLVLEKNMTERPIKLPEQRIIPEKADWYFFSTHALLALAVAELGQKEPQQAQHLAIKIVAEGLRISHLKHIQLEKEKGKPPSSLRRTGSLLSFISRPRQSEIRFGPFSTSASVSQSLGPIASEGSVIFIKSLLTHNLDRPGQKEFIAQMKERFEAEEISFDSRIGVVRTLIGLCSGHPAIENQNLYPLYTARQLTAREIEDRFSFQEHQQAFAQPFLVPEELAVVLKLIDHPQPKTQLPPILTYGTRTGINWYPFLTESLVRLATGALADQRVEYIQQAIQTIQAQRKHG
jgi:hypothetical protein